jgi:muramidase (phage lysozyme)
MAKVESKYFKAMLDTIAYTEGTLGVSQNGYDILFNFYKIKGWNEDVEFGHKGKEWYYSQNNTSAAGRYQFVMGTWWDFSRRFKDTLNLTKEFNEDLNGRKYEYNAPFTKENQDFLAFKYLENRRVTEEDLIKASKSAKDFSDFITNKKLGNVWSSLKRASTGKDAKHKGICKGGNCSSGAEEILTVFNKALKKYS